MQLITKNKFVSIKVNSYFQNRSGPSTQVCIKQKTLERDNPQLYSKRWTLLKASKFQLINLKPSANGSACFPWRFFKSGERSASIGGI